VMIKDPEVRILAAISQGLQADYQSEDSSWEGSPFAWIRLRPSRQVGAIGERLVAGLLLGTLTWREPPGPTPID